MLGAQFKSLRKEQAQQILDLRKEVGRACNGREVPETSAVAEAQREASPTPGCRPSAPPDNAAHLQKAAAELALSDA